MQFKIQDLGRMSYGPCADFQRDLLDKIVGGDEESTLLLVEHEPVITLGAAFHPENLLKTAAEYKALGIDVVETERGGDVTYHGPGQLVAYPIFDLQAVYAAGGNGGKPDLHLWLRDLEEVALKSIAGLGIEGRRFAGYTGAWVQDKKICAIGIKVRRWVSMDGLALNCNADLSPFSLIVPCGISDYGVTSVSGELGREVGVEEMKPLLIDAFQKVFV